MTKIETATFALAEEMARLARAACDKHDIHAVHYLVTEMRRLERLPHTLKMRGIIESN